MLHQRLAFILQRIHSIIVNLLEVLQVHVLHSEVFDLLLPLVNELLLLFQIFAHVLVLLSICLQLGFEPFYLILSVLDQVVQKLGPMDEACVFLLVF